MAVATSPTQSEAPAPGKTRRIARKKASTGVQVLPLNFSDATWKRDLVMEAILADRGWTYRYIRVATDKVKGLDSSRTQVRTHTNQVLIEDYAASMKLGMSQFDAITVDSDMEGTDFFHRLSAARLAGLQYVIVLQVERKLAVWERHMVAARRNNKHGQRQTHQENREIAVQALAEGKSVEYVSRELEIPLSTVKRYASESEAKTEARDLGVEKEFSKLPASVAGTIPSSMHAPVKKETIKLLHDSGATAAKAKDIVAAIEAAPTDLAAKKVIKDLRAKRVPQPGTSVRRVMSESEASGLITQRSGLLRNLLKDVAVTSALLQSTASNSKFKLVKETLEELRDGLDPLFTHYGV